VKIILSRKGVDSANGGFPSPIFPDNTFVSIPIPDSCSQIAYKDITLRGLPGGKLVQCLSRNRVRAHDLVHLDPDLDPNTLSVRMPGWRPLFGQSHSAGAHLVRHQIGVGDLFLFFGWFRQVEFIHGRWRYKPGAPHLHVIFGWLQVGAVLAVEPQTPSRLPWAAYHPHLARNPRRKHNILYVSASELEIEGIALGLPGAGLFPKFDRRLCLTAPGRLRSIWRLPSWFYPAPGRRPLSFHENLRRWTNRCDHVLLRSVSRGQEFILHCEDYPEAKRWLGEIFTLARSSHSDNERAIQIHPAEPVTQDGSATTPLRTWAADRGKVSCAR